MAAAPCFAISAISWVASLLPRRRAPLLGILLSLAGIVPSPKVRARALFWARCIPGFSRRALEGYGSIPDKDDRARGERSVPLWGSGVLVCCRGLTAPIPPELR